MIEYSDEAKKIDILTHALSERYQAIHVIRQRVESLTLWTLGILFGLGTWLFSESITLGCAQKKLYIISIIIAFSIFRFKYLTDLNKGFKKQLQVAAVIEERLGLFEKNYFGKNEDSVYPESWSKAGTDSGEGNYFKTNYYLLYVGVVFLLISILFK